MRRSQPSGALRAAEPGDSGRARRWWRRRGYVAAGSAVLLLAGAGIAAVAAGSGPDFVVPVAGTQKVQELDFTTFSPPSVQRVDYSYRNGVLALGKPELIADLPGADGIAFSPTGNLLIGGQRTGKLFELSGSGSLLHTVPVGAGQAYLVTVAPGGKAVYTAGLPGALAEIPLDPPGPGRVVALSGDNTKITGVAFGPSGQALYTASGANGYGDIGLLDLATGRTHRLFSGIVGAHGITYDPYSRSYMVIGGDTVLQLPASDPSRIASELTQPGLQFDQGAVTGRGQAFFASNTGQLVMVDYSSTGRIGDVHDVVQTAFLATNLDDVAPLSGPGARPVATSAPTFRLAGYASLGASGLMATALVARQGWQGGRSRRRRLPRWDKRRRATADTNRAVEPDGGVAYHQRHRA